VRFAAVHDTAVRILAQGLLDLGLLPAGDLDGVIERGDYKRFYLHQTSHWLGLDVHDAGPYRAAGESIALAPGMVLTIEPGLYIPADLPSDEGGVADDLRGVGVRIEDDVVVTEEGREVLTRGVPVAPGEIEEVMRGG
jgi:Xaa-Pro aminopeptidase